MVNNTDTNTSSNGENNETVFDSDADPRELRLKKHPSGWVQLTQDTELVLVLDAILDSQPDEKYSRGVIEQQTGITGDVLTEKMTVLASLGVITFCNDDTENWYKVTSTVENDVLESLTKLNSIMNAEYSDA